MTTLDIRQPRDTLAHIQSWSNLGEDDLRRRAMTAATDRDVTTLWDLTKAHMTLGRSYSEHTLAAYERNIARLVEAWQHVNILRPARDDGRLYKIAISQTLKPSSVQQALSAAKALYAALRWARATDAKPFYDVRPDADPIPAKDKRDAYTLAELRVLVGAALDPSVNTDTSVALAVLLGARAGLRVSEMVGRRVKHDDGTVTLVGGVRWHDFDLVNMTLRVTHGKGNKQRSLPLDPYLADFVAKLRSPDRAAPVFGGITPHTLRARLRRFFEHSAVQVDYKGVHSLRHTFAMTLKGGGVQLGDIGELLGHSSDRSTAIYARMDNSAARDAVAKLPPLQGSLGLEPTR